MIDAKPIPTPMATSLNLKLNDGTSFAIAIEYRQLLGLLQYLNMTQARHQLCSEQTFTVHA